jgi:hypothetical protein
MIGRMEEAETYESMPSAETKKDRDLSNNNRCGHFHKRTTSFQSHPWNVNRANEYRYEKEELLLKYRSPVQRIGLVDFEYTYFMTIRRNLCHYI